MIRAGVTTLATALACNVLVGCDFERCVPANVVRIKINGTVYHLPASVRPGVFGSKLRTEFRLRDGRNVKEYCQKPEAPPAPASAFGFVQPSITRLTERRPEFADLSKLELIDVIYAPAGTTPAENASGDLVFGGRFRRGQTSAAEQRRRCPQPARTRLPVRFAFVIHSVVSPL